jgi:hypothetical protein
MKTRSHGLVWLATVLALAPTAAGAQPVWQEDFDGPGDLPSRGWRVEATETQSLWTLTGGHLEVQCFRGPYQGGRIVHEVPLVPRGVLEFDCLLAAEGIANYDHLSLGLKLYGHLMAFKRYAGHHLLVHVPATNTDYSVTGTVPLQQWVHFRVEYDAPRGRVEYYLGDARDPLMVDLRLAMKTEGAPGEFELFNYGLTKGPVTNLVDNISLRALDEANGATLVTRDRTLLFLGPSSERLGVAAALQAGTSPESLSVYTLQTRSAATEPRNIFGLDRMPGTATWRQARTIVLADVPAGPRECLPPHLLEDLERAVQAGADLLVLGGPFSLGKGEYAGTALERLLPVTLGGPWEVRRFDAPRPIAGLSGKPAVLWYHGLAPKAAHVQTGLRAGDVPLHAWWPVGKGRVGVFLGAPLGSPEDFGGAVPFWEAEGWPEVLRKLAAFDRIGEEG